MHAPVVLYPVVTRRSNFTVNVFRSGTLRCHGYEVHFLPRAKSVKIRLSMSPEHPKYHYSRLAWSWSNPPSCTLTAKLYSVSVAFSTVVPHGAALRVPAAGRAVDARPGHTGRGFNAASLGGVTTSPSRASGTCKLVGITDSRTKFRVDRPSDEQAIHARRLG